jgi:hypothetical protein
MKFRIIASVLIIGFVILLTLLFAGSESPDPQAPVSGEVQIPPQ